MARGIKKSGGGIANIYYHTWDKVSGGEVSLSGPTYFVPGVGLDELAEAQHTDIKPDELNSTVPVYLESAEASILPNWHKSSTLLDTPITSISSSESNDVDLYAKWTYSFYQDNIKFEVSDRPQAYITVSQDDTIFTWG